VTSIISLCNVRSSRAGGGRTPHLITSRKVYAAVVEWLLLLVIPVVVLIFAVQALHMALLWRELKTLPRRLRDQPRRARIASFASLVAGVAWAIILIRAFEGHGGQTLAYVLLAIFGSLAAFSVLVLPPLVWREERRRRARRG
jgi:amino acid transporter